MRPAGGRRSAAPRTIEDPAPDVRRAEGVEEGVEHGSGVVAGRSSASADSSASAVGVARGRRRSSAASSASVGVVGAGRVGLGRRLGVVAPSASAVGLGGLARGRPWRAFGSACGVALRSAVSAARPRAAARPRLRGSAAARPAAGARLRRRPAVSGVDARGPASGVVGISRTLTLPPAASILARADAVNASATTKSGGRQLAGAEDLERLVERPDEPDGAQDVLVDRDRAGLGALGAAVSASNAPRSASAPMAPTFTTSYSILNRFLKPRSLGMRMWSGVWPPSNQGGIEPPARAFWPLVPRPAVLPLPAAMPRPTRVRAVRDPAAGRRSWSFMPSPRSRSGSRRRPRSPRP